MTYQEKTLFFPAYAIKEFLLFEGKGAQSKDYEFITAILLKNFCEKQFGKKCEIGFKIKDEAMRNLPEQGEIDFEKMVHLLRKEIKEDSEVDCVIATDPLHNNGKRQGMAFQLKRFGGIEKQFRKDLVTDDTDYLISKLKDLGIGYAKSDTALVYAIEDGVEIEWGRIKKEIDLSNFPFTRTMFTFMKNNKICVIEVYPLEGMEEYDAWDMVD